MISSDKLFGNFFNDKEITTTRLYNFGIDAQNKITAANSNNRYDAILEVLANPLTQLGAELGDVDTAVTVQKGATLTNNQVLAAFKQAVSEQEPFIVRAVGGRGSAAALEFFPKGLSEYTSATKTVMPMLTNRINAAATKYATQLGADLTALLQAFQLSWVNSRDAQQQQIGNVNTNRNERDDIRTQAELALLFAVHTVAAAHAGEIAGCTALFDFSLLFGSIKRRQQDFTGIVAAASTVTILNRTLKDSNVITAHNTDDNAAWCIYLGNTEKEVPPANAITLQPGDTKTIRSSELGSLNNTFLLIKNLSDVNDGSYDVEVAGAEK